MHTFKVIIKIKMISVKKLIPFFILNNTKFLCMYNIGRHMYIYVYALQLLVTC